jgi:eukaryotic translation initiation factor 2C
LKNRNRGIQFLQHLHNVVAPNIFDPQIVYDVRTLAYSPGRPYIPETPKRWSSCGSKRFHRRRRQGEGVAYQIRFIQTSCMPVQPTDINPLIYYQPQSIGALRPIVRVIGFLLLALCKLELCLIIRQGPNLYNTNNGRAYFPNDRSQIRDIGGALERRRGIYHSIHPAPQKKDTYNHHLYCSSLFGRGPV